MDKKNIFLLKEMAPLEEGCEYVVAELEKAPGGHRSLTILGWFNTEQEARAFHHMHYFG